MSEEKLSSYMTTFYCKACKWFHNPFKKMTITVCPECGEGILRQVGRFKYITKRVFDIWRWWLPIPGYYKQTFLTDFIPGKKEKKINKKVKKMGCY